jgi:hypothetical protein
VGFEQCLDARTESCARTLENLADCRRLDADGSRDLAGVELGAIAQAHDRPLALGQLAERDEQCAPLPRAVEIVDWIDGLVRRLGQLTGCSQLGTRLRRSLRARSFRVYSATGDKQGLPAALGCTR